MYCVIQEIRVKKHNDNGSFKDIVPYRWSMGGIEHYAYRQENRFKRNIKKSYKISIHHSYRENGRGKKKQWHITTINYYDFIDYSSYIGDYCFLDKKAEIIGIETDELYNLIQIKLDDISKKVEEEFKKTEEYKIKKQNEEILRLHRKRESEFNKKYGDYYSQCYDVFGNLMNEERLNDIKEQYIKRKDYEEQSKRSYYEYYKSNHSYNTSSYFDDKESNYNEEEKKLLKEAFKLLAFKHHPDRGGSTEKMASINNLKEKILK